MNNNEDKRCNTGKGIPQEQKVLYGKLALIPLYGKLSPPLPVDVAEWRADCMSGTLGPQVLLTGDACPTWTL